ncbi:hypothetical protein VNI00_002801 [Paramarasmius palmivorus]|uniref:Methyltransferase domain-containing protein n=1 Tax=Paramarasmius palmivorus TaxID=297713 RepID=A0AAW0DV05_9AGAR
MGNGGLPLELLMHTMKFVESREHLQDCSLVSQVWRVAAQSEIFSTITIRNESECRFWDDKFSQSPHLASFVRNLKLRDPKSHASEVDPPQYLVGGGVAERLLKRLTHVRSLSVDSFHLWGMVERQVVFKYKALESLELYNISLGKALDLIEFILELPQLTRLTMGRASAIGRSGLQNALLDFENAAESGIWLRGLRPKSGMIGMPKRLSFLCLYDVEACVDTLMWLTGQAFDLSNIQELCLFWLCFGDDASEISLPNDYFNPLDELIRLVGSRVRVLHLGMPIYTEDEAGQAFTTNDYDVVCTHLSKSRILSHFTELETITLSYVDFDDCQDTLPVALQAAVSLLSTLSAPRLREISLEEVDIKLDLTRNMRGIGTLPEWRVLDDLVTGTAFPVLKEVNISLSIICRSRSSLANDVAGKTPDRPIVTSEQVETVIGNCMPKAVGKGLLTLDMLDKQFWFYKNVHDRNLIIDPKVAVPLDGAVLDAATGPGTWIRALAKEFSPSISMHAVDIAPGLWTSTTAVVPPNVHYTVASVTLLPNDWTNKFDLVNQAFLYAYLKAPDWALNIPELYRVTKPGGHIQLIEPTGRRAKLPSDLAASKIQEVPLGAARMNGSLENIVSGLPPILETAGFHDITVEVKPPPRLDMARDEAVVEGLDYLEILFDAMEDFVISHEEFGVKNKEEYDALRQRHIEEVRESDSPIGVELCYICARKPVAA